MAQQDYSSSITANITAQQAAERISRVPDWWSGAFSGASDKVGDTFKLDWGKTFVDFVVEESIPAKKIVWRVTNCNLDFVQDKKEWKDTRVAFEITSEGSATRVTMTHAGLRPDVECYTACKTGWDFYILESLQNLLRENRGFPDRQGRKESPQEAVAQSAT